MQRANSLENTLMLGKIGGWRRKGWQRMRWLDGITDSMAMSLSKFQEIVKDRKAWRAAVHGVTKNQTRLRDWTDFFYTDFFFFLMFPVISCTRISRVEESALRALREKLFAHSSDILVEFKKHDKDETGKTNQIKYSEEENWSKNLSHSN